VREPSKELVRAVRQSTLPTLLFRVPGEEILAASDEASRLFGVPVEDLVGRNVEDFADGQPTGALPLVATGTLSGFQARRRWRRPDGEWQPLQAWIRGADTRVPVEFAISILWPADRSAWSYLPGHPGDAEGVVVVGTVNGRMEIERVSDDVRSFGSEPDDVIGSSVFRLFDVTSAADVLAALARATARDQGVCIAVNVHVNGKPALADLLLRPTHPSPSFSFSMMYANRSSDTGGTADERSLQQLGRGLQALALADAFTLLQQANVPGVDKLTTRELDITARLLSGDRVPAIASSIYLSQSTVRNHLSRVFHKLGVSSQQEMIERFRETAERLRVDDTSSS
jgi:DNA-binding CsgD family transcriptional regulator